MRNFSIQLMTTAGFSTIGSIVLAGMLIGLPASAQAGTGLVISPSVRDGKIDTAQHPYPTSSTNWGRAVALVDAPADDVMAIVQDYATYKDYLPGFKASRVLSQRGASALVYVQVSVLKGALTFWAELKIKPHQGGSTRVIEASMTKGNVEIFKATWEVTPFDENRSLVAFQLIVEPDLPLPSSLVSKENVDNARTIIRALRKRIVALAELKQKP
jgi:ribosome-associated toxin RatA of RatAB toxin-antitoxin module